MTDVCATPSTIVSTIFVGIEEYQSLSFMARTDGAVVTATATVEDGDVDGDVDGDGDGDVDDDSVYIACSLSLSPNLR